MDSGATCGAVRFSRKCNRQSWSHSSHGLNKLRRAGMPRRKWFPIFWRCVYEQLWPPIVVLLVVADFELRPDVRWAAAWYGAGALCVGGHRSRTSLTSSGIISRSFADKFSPAGVVRCWEFCYLVARSEGHHLAPCQYPGVCVGQTNLAGWLVCVAQRFSSAADNSTLAGGASIMRA